MKKKLSGIALIALFTLMTLVSSAATPGVCGEVRNGVTGESVPYANIFVEGTEVGVLTNEAGKFTISGLEEGSYIVRLTAAGYKDKKISIKIGNSSGVDCISISWEEDAEEMSQYTIVPTGDEPDMHTLETVTIYPSKEESETVLSEQDDLEFEKDDRAKQVRISPAEAVTDFLDNVLWGM